jgi:hypothetical protein
VCRTSDHRAALLKALIPLYDLRQGALTGRLPFRDDTRKETFYRSLLELDDRVHVSGLFVGDEIVAGNIGLCHSGTVEIGVFAYSPIVAAHSPGKLFLLLLAEQLHADGFEAIDLTPSGEYKERFADLTSPVHTLRVFPSKRAAVTHDLARNARAALKTRLRQFPEMEKRLRSFIQPPKAENIPARSWFVIEARMNHSGAASANHIDTLLDFAAEPEVRRQHFARELQRLENGWAFYSDGPTNRAWRAPRDGDRPGAPVPADILGQAVVFRDYTGDGGFANALVAVGAREHAPVVIEVRVTDHQSRTALAQLGTEYV